MYVGEDTFEGSCCACSELCVRSLRQLPTDARYTHFRWNECRGKFDVLHSTRSDRLLDPFMSCMAKSPVEGLKIYSNICALIHNDRWRKHANVQGRETTGHRGSEDGLVVAKERGTFAFECHT